MAAQIFVNLPVKELGRSVAFFKKLGYTFNPQFTNEHATCMIVSETIFVMLLVEPFFKTFTNREIADTRLANEALLCLSANSRQEVDEMVNKALQAGASAPRKPQDHGFMYGWGFEDLDGHVWEYMWMDSANVKQ